MVIKMPDKNDDKNKGSNKMIWFILWGITIIVLLISGFYYSKMVENYTGQEITGCIGSIYDEFTSCC